MFQNFPEHVAWERVILTQEELWQVKYIDDDYWVELSGGSRLAIDAAQAILTGTVIFDVPNDGFLRLAQALRHGAAFPELILVCAGEQANIVVLEGYVRLTAYALVPEAVPGKLTAILGTSPDMEQWNLY